ncbi:MAG TPA: hypothetical protein VMR33_19955 [Candidatus Baltobacteraceae bacterium]|jgi:hypothetical protein|nr:hypothetical protein [Candidatus Baltobacteraceae bacterium]
MKSIILLLALGGALTLNAQTTTNTPRTYFEAYNAVADAPLLKGITVIGTLNNQINYPVEIRVEALTNLQTSNTVYAVSLHTRLSSKQLEVDYIDYDELDGLIRGVQFVSQTAHGQNEMDSFEAAYRTRSGLSVLKVSNGNKLTILMRSGDVLGARNQMASFVLDDLGRYLTAAKAKLDSLASGGQ